MRPMPVIPSAEVHIDLLLAIGQFPHVVHGLPHNTKGYSYVTSSFPGVLPIRLPTIPVSRLLIEGSADTTFHNALYCYCYDRYRVRTGHEGSTVDGS